MEDKTNECSRLMDKILEISSRLAVMEATSAVNNAFYVALIDERNKLYLQKFNEIEEKAEIVTKSEKEALDKALVGTDKAMDKAADDMNSKFASANAVIEEQRKTINDLSIKVGNMSGI